MTIFRFNIFASVILLSSCSPEPDARICLNPPEPSKRVASEVKSVGEQIEMTQACVNLWAYRLANGREGAEVTARAVVEACRLAIQREASWNEGARDKFFDGDFNRQVADLEKSYFEAALYRVVQARAGKCEFK